MSRSNTSDPTQRIELTPRQQDVIRLIAKGHTNGEIAERLDLTLDGVKWHVREILGKFGVDSREAAVDAWRADRGPANRVRNWAGALWASSAVRWAGGLAVAAVGGVAIIAGALQSDDPQPESPVAAAIPTSDPATKDGLTLSASALETDTIQTRVTLTLAGRPELGPIMTAGLGVPPGSLVLTDEQGTIYSPSGFENVGDLDGRSITFTFPPLPADARSVRIVASGAKFVNPAGLVAAGQPVPPYPASVAGPWATTLDDVHVTPSKILSIGSAMQPLGPGEVAIESVVQAESTTVVSFLIEDWPEEFAEDAKPGPTILDSNGDLVFPIGGNRVVGPGLVEWWFPPLKGQITVRMHLPQLALRSPDELRRAVSLASGRESEIRTSEARRVRISEILAAFANQPPATFTLTLP